MKKLAIAAVLLLMALFVACSNDAYKGLELSPGWPSKTAPIYPSGIILSQKEIGSEQTQNKTNWVECYIEEDYDKVINFYKNRMQGYSDYNLNYDDYDGDRMSTITAQSGSYDIKVNISAKKQENYSTCIVDIYLTKQ